MMPVFKKLHLEAFLDNTLELIEAETAFHCNLQQKCNGTQDCRSLVTKILLGLLQGPADEGMDDDFIATYLVTSHEYLEGLLTIKKAALDSMAQHTL